MAEAALVVQDPDRERFNRFVSLMMDEGTTIIRGLFDHIHPPSTLSHVLQKQHRLTLDELRSKRILTHEEWDKLFPPATSYGESKEFDLTLLFKLLRNICNLTAPSNGWDKLPANSSDRLLEDELARIKYHRNCTYAHTRDARLSENDFNKCWDETLNALKGILTVYKSPKYVRNWERKIENLRRGPISSEGNQKWLKGFPKMAIVASLGVVAGAAAQPFFKLLKDNIPWADLMQNVQTVISQSGGIVVKDICNGSVVIQLCIKDVTDLEDLWKRYKNGRLKSELEKVLITDDIRKLGKDVELDITMSEDEYLDARSFFEEIISSHQPQKGKFGVEVKEMTERLKELSLDIIHGDTIIDRGSQFQGHFAEVTSEDQIDKVVDHIKKDPMYTDATNIVWAYKLYDSDKDTFIYDSDDGDEYFAGKRLQLLLERIHVKDIVVIVTCWQGEENLDLDIYKNINERVLSLLMLHGLIESKTPEELAKSLEKFEAYFEKRKHKIAHAAYKALKQAEDPEAKSVEFDFIHSEVAEDRKSKFQAHLARVTSQEQVEQALAQLKRDSKIAKATYNMVAYRIFVKEKKSYLEDGRDDGENEAGKRLLHLLQVSNVVDKVVIVTRWHGGVHIGPDRFKHINACALEVIKMATEQETIVSASGSTEASGSKKKKKTKGKQK